MWTPDSPEVNRSLGWMNRPEQQQLLDSTVCIAGLGGAGYDTALSLVRAGVQRLRVADLDTIDRENFNRVPGATVHSIGRLKTEQFYDDALAINPDATIEVFPDGVTADNVDDFVAGVSVGFDGIDLNRPDITTMYARTLRKAGKAMVSGMEIGPSAMVTSFHPDARRHRTFERVAGFKDDEPLDEIKDKAEQNLDLTRLVPYLPYTSGDTGVLKAVMDGAPLPSDAEGTKLYASIANRELKLHLMAAAGNHRESPVWAPNYYVVDNSRRFGGIIKSSPLRFKGYVALAFAREQLHLNPRAGSYESDTTDNICT